MIIIMQLEIIDLFEGPSSREVQIAAQDYLFHASEAVGNMFFVLSGLIHLIRRSHAGHEIILQRAQFGSVLAEASVWSENYHCDARAMTDCSFISVPRTDFQKRLVQETSRSEAWTKHLASSVQTARLLAEIRTFKTVRERLDLWLAEFGPLPDPGKIQNVAFEIGVTREALYRELSRRRSNSTNRL